jgi:2-dehydro-3-deoxyphosphooctonate aldolase (KDO 8-P synthase)
MKLCGFEVGLDQPFFLIAGTCSIEGLQMSLDVAGHLKETCAALGVALIYKGSFDKANRSSGTSARGVGMDAGLKILEEVRRQTGLPVLRLSCAGRPISSALSPSRANRSISRKGSFSRPGT